jgi:hypothetical protein
MKDWRLLWIFSAAGLLALRLLLPAQWIETLYSRGLFLPLRGALDLPAALSPVPVALLLVLGLLGWLFFSLFFRKKREKRPLGESIREILLSIGGFVGAGISLFLLLWGFHYGRPPLEVQLGLACPPLDSVALREEALWHARRADSLRRSLSRVDTIVPITEMNGSVLESHVRGCLALLLRRLGYPAPGRVRCRVLPGGTLLRWGIAGIYMPFSGEGHVDGGLHPLERPYTMAHEMAHAFGIPGEADCNALAALACELSSDPFVRYGGALAHWRLVMGELRTVAPVAFGEIRLLVSEDVRRDLRALREHAVRYPDWFPELSGRVNHAYLRAQGVAEGIKSYDRAVGLLRAYRLSCPESSPAD